MSVWHKTLGRNYFLGEVKIPMNDFIEAHGNSLQQTIAKWFTLTEKVNVLGLKHTIDVFFSLNFIELQKRKEFGKEQKQTGGRTNKRKNVLTMGE